MTENTPTNRPWPSAIVPYSAAAAGEVCNIFAVHINEMDWNAMYHCCWNERLVDGIDEMSWDWLMVYGIIRSVMMCNDIKINYMRFLCLLLKNKQHRNREEYNLLSSITSLQRDQCFLHLVVRWPHVIVEWADVIAHDFPAVLRKDWSKFKCVCEFKV